MRTKLLFVLIALLLLAIPASAQGTTVQPTPTPNGLPQHMYIPGENDLACRHLNKEDVEKRGFISTWGGADGAFSTVRISFTALTSPVAHDFIVEQKDEAGSNIPGSAVIKFAGEQIELGQYGGQVYAYIECRPEQLLEFMLEFFKPFDRQHLTDVILGLGLRPEDYLDRPGVLFIDQAAISATVTPNATTNRENEEARSALAVLTLGDAGEEEEGGDE